jgi:cellulose biosynthesis protein BcsQ
MNITVLARKGGIGKTHTCLLLHEALRQAGKTVRVHDWNSEQGTFTKAFRSIYGHMPPVSGEFEYNIWDTPPDLEMTATETAVLNAEVALVVGSPEPADMWEIADAVDFVLQKNPAATLRVVFNKMQKGRLLSRFVEDYAKTLKAATLPVMLNTRECYKHAIAQGWNALDYAAREEAFQLALAVASLTVKAANK